MACLWKSIFNNVNDWAPRCLLFNLTNGRSMGTFFDITNSFNRWSQFRIVWTLHVTKWSSHSRFTIFIDFNFWDLVTSTATIVDNFRTWFITTCLLCKRKGKYFIGLERTYIYFFWYNNDIKYRLNNFWCKCN